MLIADLTKWGLFNLNLKLILSFLILFFGSSCGYVFQGSSNILPQDIKRIYIPIVSNFSTESSITLLLTESVKDEFEKYGIFQIVDSSDSADATLVVKILDITRDTKTSTSNTDSALELDTTLSVSGVLKRTNGQNLWKNNLIKARDSYGSTSDVVVSSSASFGASAISASDLGNLSSREVSRGQEREVFERLSEDIARSIYNQAVIADF